jgi:tetratricopeptide (TPR) repeat protein
MLWKVKIIFSALLLVIITFLGEICVLLKMYDTAGSIYKLGFKLWPNKRGEFSSRLGFVYERSGDLGKALEFYKEACRLEPNKGFNYIELGSIYEKQNQRAFAIECFEKGLQVGADLSQEFKDGIQSKINKLKQK